VTKKIPFSTSFSYCPTMSALPSLPFFVFGQTLFFPPSGVSDHPHFKFLGTCYRPGALLLSAHSSYFTSTVHSVRAVNFTCGETIDPPPKQQNFQLGFLRRPTFCGSLICLLSPPRLKESETPSRFNKTHNIKR